MINGIIYMYTSPSGKQYIGQTIDEIKRKSRFKNLTYVYAGGGKLENARKKYLPENFNYEILESIQFENKDAIGDTLNDLEMFYIEKFDTYKTGYNSSPGGQFNYSEKSSKSKIGTKHTEETKAKISKGIKKTKRAEGYFQNPMSDENIEKARKRSSKMILQYNLEGEFMKEWPSGKAAGEFYNTDPSGILKCCNGKNHTSAGYVWRFKISDEIEEKIILNIPQQSKDIAQITAQAKDKSGKNKMKRIILQFDLEGNLLGEWESSASIFRHLGVNGGGEISRVCTGKQKTAYGFIWKYKN